MGRDIIQVEAVCLEVCGSATTSAEDQAVAMVSGIAEPACPDWKDLLAGADEEDTHWAPAWREDWALACIGRFVDKRREDVFDHQYISKPTPLQACFDAICGLDDADGGRRGLQRALGAARQHGEEQRAVLPGYLAERGRDARIDAIIAALRRARAIEGSIVHASGTDKTFLSNFLQPLIEEQSQDFDTFALEPAGAVRVLPSGWGGDMKVRSAASATTRRFLSPLKGT